METSEIVVFVEGDFSAEEMARVRALPGVRAEFFEQRPDLEARIEEADVVAGRIGPSALGRAGRLRWIQSWAAGPNDALYPEMIDSPVLLTSCKGNGAVPLAEHAMMLMLMLNRDALRWIDAQRSRRWESFFHGELAGLTCGIIGLGGSGEDLALKAKAFHMHVIGLRRTQSVARHVDELLPRERLDELLARSDFVVVTAPLTPETKGMLGEGELRVMKSSAFLIVFSRGGIVQEPPLLRALEEGWIAGAGLDVMEEEPLPEDSPFWNLPNVLITPHDGSTTQGTRQRGFEIFLENLARFTQSRPLLNVVDKVAGY